MQEARAIHPKICEIADIGVVPFNQDATVIFDPLIAELREAFTAAKTEQDKTTLEAEIDKLDRLKSDFIKIIVPCSGWLVFLFTDGVRPTAFQLRKPYTKEFLTWKVSGRLGVFGLGMAARLPGNIPESLGDVFVVSEGPFNLLALQSLLLRNGYGLAPGCAVGGAATVDLETLRKIDARFLVIADHDESGFGLVERVVETRSLWAVTTPGPGSDLDDFIRSYGCDYGGAFQAVECVLKGRKRFFRPASSVRGEIHEVRTVGRCAEGTREAAGIILETDMEQRGSLHHDGQRSFFLDDESKRLFEISPDCLGMATFLADRGIYPGEHLLKPVIGQLSVMARERGSFVTPRVFSHYEAGVLYVGNGGTMLRLSVDRGDEVPNGSDGVVFLDQPGHSPFQLDAPAGVIDKLFESLPDKQAVLAKLFLLSLFFPNLMATKVLLVALGDQGSFKSTFLKKIGWLLQGPLFQLVTVTHKLDDFDAAITTLPLAFLDQVDDAEKWLEDRLAIAATGGKIGRRTYYTTNSYIDFPIVAQIALSTRTFAFARPDVADRALVLPFTRPKKFIAESKIKASILESRGAFWGELVGLLQSCLRCLAETENQEFTVPYRMADFATFALRVSGALGLSAERVRTVLDVMTLKQAGFALEGSGIYRALVVWLDRYGNRGRLVSARDLIQDLSAIAMKNRIHLRPEDPRSAKALGKWIAKHRRNLKALHGLEIVTVSHSRERKYVFGVPDPQPSGIAGTVALQIHPQIVAIPPSNTPT